jgi:hypothetical protein
MERVNTLSKGIQVENTEPAPLVIPVLVKPGMTSMIAGGTPMPVTKVEYYVCIEQLPRELQERINTAIDALMRV